MDNHCHCGGSFEAGRLQARNMGWGVLGSPELGMEVSRFAYVRPGAPTSANPVKALAQGMREEPEDVLIPLAVLRCTACGRVELFADEA